MTDIYVIGVAMTKFARHPAETVKSLTARAVKGALADAAVPTERIGLATFANTVQGTLEGQIMIRGQVALRPLGLEGIPIINTENACASSATGFNIAVNYLKAGVADVALAVGVDKMVVPDKGAMLGIFDGAWDVYDIKGGKQRLIDLGLGSPMPPGIEEMPTRSFFMDVYSSFAKAHMSAFGTTQRHLAAVSAKNHTHASLNPLAQYQDAMTIDEVLSAKTVVWPLTLPMCAPVSDGAAAAIVCTADALAEMPAEVSARAVRVLSSQLLTGVVRRPDQHHRHLCHIGAMRAYEEAGVGPADISVAEVHDATAFAEILQTENLGFCAFGDGGALAERGETSLGGRIPVNPSGGLESKGHPIGATGLGQIFELTSQLRGEAGGRQVPKARLAIAENGGGLYGIEEAVAAITILSA